MEKSNSQDPKRYADLAKALFIKVREIKKKNKEASKSIDFYMNEIRSSMEQIKESICTLDKYSSDLLLLLLINEIHRTIDEFISH